MRMSEIRLCLPFYCLRYKRYIKFCLAYFFFYLLHYTQAQMISDFFPYPYQYQS